MNKVRINQRLISDLEPCFIIAEAGLNHNGDINLAKKLIKKASDIKADAVKFQIIYAEEICNKKNKAYDFFKKIEFSQKDWLKLSNYSKELNIIFSASVFGKKSADILEDVDSPFFKIASGDLTYHQLLEYVARKKKPIILSTGMSKFGEIKEALDVIYATDNKSVILMHCISNYPANYNEINLMFINKLKQEFKIPVGYSDHSIGNSISFAAVALGANVIEKHFTLNKNLEGPDHRLSLDPKEFSDLIKGIRYIEEARGDGERKLSELELKTLKLARRSIYAKKLIKKGQTITDDMINIVRPLEGIEPKYKKDVIGKKAKKNIIKNEAITWKKL